MQILLSVCLLVLVIVGALARASWRGRFADSGSRTSEGRLALQGDVELQEKGYASPPSPSDIQDAYVGMLPF